MNVLCTISSVNCIKSMHFSKYIKVYNAQSKFKNFHKKSKGFFFNPIDNKLCSEIQKNEHTLKFEEKTFSNHDIVTLLSHVYDKEKKN